MSIESAEMTARRAFGVAAYYSRRDQYDPKKIAEARRDGRAAQLEAAVHQALAAAPPLTTDQRERLAALLQGGEQR